MKQGFVIQGNSHYLFNFDTCEQCMFDSYGEFRSISPISVLNSSVRESCLVSLLGTNQFCDLCAGNMHHVFNGVSVLDMQKQLRSVDAFKQNMLSIIPYRISHQKEGFVGLQHIVFVMNPDFRAGALSQLLSSMGVVNYIEDWVQMGCVRN